MRNRVIKMKPRMSVWDRVARSALTNCTHDEWLSVINEAQSRGIIPTDLLWCDVVEFNAKASQYDGTVLEFLESMEVKR